MADKKKDNTPSPIPPPSLSHAALTAAQAHDNSTLSQVNRLRDSDDVYKKQAEAAQNVTPQPSHSIFSKITDTVDKAVGKPSYKHGTDRVPNTGLATLHKDEAVLNKDDADKYRTAKSHAIYDLAKGHMSSDHDADDKPPKEIKHITTRKVKGKDGKRSSYIHEHHHTHPEHHPMEEHVSNGQDEMVGHMMDNMGDQNPGEAQADAGQSGAPAPAPAMPGPAAMPGA